MDELEDFDLPPIGNENPLDVSDKSLKGDDKLDVTFYTKAVQDHYATSQKGVPVFIERDYIVIKTPGSTLTTIDAPVKEYLPRFNDKYRAWKKNTDTVVSGNPIESLPFLRGKVGQIAQLKAMNINTVEQLAELPDVYVQRIMGGFELQRRALDWVGNNAGIDTKVSEAIDESAQELKKENAELKARVDSMEQVMSHLAEPSKSRRRSPVPAEPAIEAPAFLTT
jgi:hypothetical protein